MKQNSFYLVIILLICVVIVGIIYFKEDLVPLIKNLTNRPCALGDTISKPTKFGVKRDRYINCLPLEVYFKSTTTDEEINLLIKQLNTMQNIYYVKYVTKGEAVVQYKQSIRESSQLLELSPKGNFLPAKVLIYVKIPSSKESILQFLKSQKFIDVAQ